MKIIYEKGDKLRVIKTGKIITVEHHTEGFVPPIWDKENGYMLEEVERVDGTLVTKINLGKDYVMPGGGHEVDFKCHRCDCTVLEEVMGGVTHTSNIRKIVTEDGEYDAQYGESSQDGGEVESIQCCDCGTQYGKSLEDVVESYRNALFPQPKKKHLKG